MADPLPVVARGSNSPTEQRRVIEFDPSRGYTVNRSLAGLSSDQMLAVLNDSIRQGMAGQYVFENGIAHLEINDATQNFVLDTWQIVGNTENRDGFSHPYLVAATTPDQIAKMRQGLENITSSALDVTTLISEILEDDIFDGADTALLTRYMVLYITGQSEYRRAQYVLRHTTNAPPIWDLNVSDEGVDMIYTPDQLLNEAQNTSLWVNPLPDRLAYKIQHIPTPDPIANYLWGWLKSPSTETLAANNRIEIITEYCLEMWSTDYYDPF